MEGVSGGASREVLRQRWSCHDMPRRLLRIAVEVAFAPARRAGIFEPESVQVFVDFQHVVLFARLRADDVARLHVVIASFAADLRFSLEDQPVLVEVMIMTVEAAAFAGHAKDAS